MTKGSMGDMSKNFTMNRRAMMAASGAALALGALPTRLLADTAGGFVDAHCHAWSSDTAKYPMAEGKTADDLKPRDVLAPDIVAKESPLGVGKVVLVQHIAFYGWDSTYLLDAAKAAPGQFAVVGAVGEALPEGPDMMVQKKAEGVKGFRVRGFGTEDWVDAPVMNKMYQVSAAEKLNICPLIRNNDKMSNDALLHLAALSDKYPDTVVVIDHMGTVMPGDDAQLANLVDLAKRGNVYVKISGFNKFDVPPYEKLKPQISALIEAYGVERLMWGSDFPVLEFKEPHTIGSAFDLINTGMGLTDDEKAWLLGRTAERAFFS